MPPQQPIPTESQPVNPSPHSHRSYWLAIIILAILAIAGSYGTYAWQNKKVKQVNAPTKATTQQTSTPSSQYVTNTVIGYPLSLAHKEVLFTLYLPSGYNVLQTNLDAVGQDALTANFTESDNDLLANWEFNNDGTPQNPAQDFSSNSGIIITALNGWMQTSDPSTVHYDLTLSNDSVAPKTTAQKTAFVTKLQNDTKTCSADSSKGFTTNDHGFQICYVVIHPQAQDGDYTLSFYGYGDLDGALAYLRGDIRMPSTYTSSSLSTYLQPLQQLSAKVQPNPNNP